jgi:anti-anti-sigma factor
VEVTPLELEGNVHVIQGEGWFDGSNADHFLIVVEQLISKGMARLIIDCSSVNTISSNGFATLLRLSHRARRQGGDLKLAGTHGMVTEALQVTRLDTIFDLYPDVETAATAFNASQD